MRKYVFSAVLFHLTLLVFSQKKIADYFPGANAWEQKPTSQYFDTAKLADAIRFAKEHEAKSPRNMELSQAMSFGKEPFGFGIGPFADRGEPTGLIISHGYIVAQWGEPSRVDMTHSV